jgi:hypothetical protein
LARDPDGPRVDVLPLQAERLRDAAAGVEPDGIYRRRTRTRLLRRREERARFGRAPAVGLDRVAGRILDLREPFVGTLLIQVDRLDIMLGRKSASRFRCRPSSHFESAFGGNIAYSYQLVTLTVESSSGAGAIVLEAKKDCAGIVAKINFALKKLTPTAD